MNKDINYNEVPEILSEFLMYMGTVRNKSQNTISEYYLDLRTFFRFIKQKRGLVDNKINFSDISIKDISFELVETITVSDLYEFMNFTITQRNNSAKTRARKTSTLKMFFRYHTQKSLKLTNDPTKVLETPKIPKTLPKYLSLEESLELLNAVDSKYKERDYCILTLFLNCGLRLSELTSLNLNSFKGEKQLIVTGKGNKQRIVYLNDACIEALKEYKKVRPVNSIKDSEALFLSRQNNRISPKTVQAMVNKYLKKIGLDGAGYSVHKLRHTAATLMYQHGNVDIRVLQDILGHENLGTTEIYTHLSNKQMENAANSNPLSKVKQHTKKYDNYDNNDDNDISKET
ncbi:MAG: tyrosine recombinase XerC [Acutalibacteraceae bacterium]|nr:tyrosine recombinase XerC [Acutalibacteraceae bacterium]